MKIFNIFGYCVTIRKRRENKPHPMDCRAYNKKIASRRTQVVNELRAANKIYLK